MSTINANDDEKLQFCALQVKFTNFIVDFHEIKTFLLVSLRPCPHFCAAVHASTLTIWARTE